MILRIMIALAMTAFCAWQGLEVSSVPTEAGRNYFPFIYFTVPFLLWGGLNPMGMITWPLATILLLVQGHWIVGWIPVALVLFNVVMNEQLKKRVTD